MAMRQLLLARIAVRLATRGGRPYVTLPSGVVVRLSLNQTASLLREDAFIRAHE